jgi:hypothetical protein
MGELMKFAKLAIAALVLAGCATGKMGKVEKALEAGAVTKTTPIIVEKIDTTDATFSGDKADNLDVRKTEKDTIEAVYYMRIVDALKAKGFNATLANGKATKGVVLTGKVIKIGHGSGAARHFIGMGAGQANLITEFHLEDRSAKKTLSKFEIVATSGAESGVTSYMDRHLNDGSKKVAEYIAGEKKD